MASADGGSPHHELVTLVITTSPTPSAPATDLISTIIASFKRHCRLLVACRVILVLDTFDRITTEPRLKKGHVTPDGAHNYAAYKDNAKRLILREYRRGFHDVVEGDEYDDSVPELLSVSHDEAEYGADAYAQETNAVPLTITTTFDNRVTFIEPAQRLGFGLAVRSALRLTTTPYVWIQQHDWSLVSDIPLAPLLDLMRQARSGGDDDDDDDMQTRQVVDVPIKYVCFPSVRMANYATSDHVMLYPGLKALTNLYKQTFSPAAVRGVVQPSAAPGLKIPLTPLFLWHDKPHLAETEHYLARVFPTRLAIPRGGFIEDTVGHRARADMKQGNWKKWACWLYYPNEGKQLCVRHLKGRTWAGAEGEVAKAQEWILRNTGGIS